MRSGRCAGPAPRRPAAAPPAVRLPAAASGRKPPGTPAARRSPPRSSAAGHPRYRVLCPGWRRAGRERCAFPRAARPRACDDGRSAPAAPSSPAPARPATPDGSLRPRGNGKGRRAARAGARGLAGGPALPEGKADRTGRGIPDGGRRHTPAGHWPEGRAGLPPGTAGINPHLCPPGQVRPAPGRDRPDIPPRATGRYGPVPAPHEQGTGRPRAGHRERGTVARARAARATVALALRVGRQPDESVPACRQHAALPERSVMARVGPACRRLSATTEIRFSGAFFTRSRKIGSCEIDGRVAAAAILSGPHAGAGCPTYCFAAHSTFARQSEHNRSWCRAPGEGPTDGYTQRDIWVKGAGRRLAVHATCGGGRVPRYPDRGAAQVGCTSGRWIRRHDGRGREAASAERAPGRRARRPLHLDCSPGIRQVDRRYTRGPSGCGRPVAVQTGVAALQLAR
jgi:hypothetical protein